MPKKVTHIFFKLFTLLLFVAVSAVTLFLAYGYQIDVKKRDVVQYSIIDLAANIKDVEVFLDNKQYQTFALPFQIKNVAPGLHTLTVIKDDFLPWERTVQVETDFVTIVNDILLIPRHLEKFDTFVKSFDSEEQFYFGKDVMVALVPGSRGFRLVTFYDNGTYKDEEIELFNESIEKVIRLEREKMLLVFRNNKYAWIDFASPRIDFFSLPAQAVNIKVNELNRNVYFIVDDNLYRIPFGYTKVHDDDFLSFKVRDLVTDYAFDFKGDFYFISAGAVFKANDRGRGVSLIDQGVHQYTNLAFKKSKNYGTLILRDKDGARVLYLVSSYGTLTKLEMHLKDQPYLNAFDQLLFSNTAGEVHFYDPHTLKKRLVASPQAPFELLGWFSDDGHFLIKDPTMLQMSNVFDGKSYELLHDKQIDRYFIMERSFFYLEGKMLSRLYWES